MAKTKTTNITRKHKEAFNALISGKYNSFALFSCFVNGKPSAAIVNVAHDGDDYTFTPLFVSITKDMILTDHDGKQA